MTGPKCGWIREFDSEATPLIKILCDLAGLGGVYLAEYTNYLSLKIGRRASHSPAIIGALSEDLDIIFCVHITGGIVMIGQIETPADDLHPFVACLAAA